MQKQPITARRNGKCQIVEAMPRGKWMTTQAVADLVDMTSPEAAVRLWYARKVGYVQKRFSGCAHCGTRRVEWRK